MVRFKRRYLLVEISFQDKKVDEDLTSTCLYQKIIQAIQECHGDYGVACTWLLKGQTQQIKSLLIFRDVFEYYKSPPRRSWHCQVKYVNPVTGVAFIACHRDYYRMVWSAMTFIKKLKQRLCMWRVLHIGGTLRSCQRFLIRYNKDQLLQALQQCKTPAERKRVLRTIKKAEKFEIPLDPLETKKRKASTKGSYNNND